MIVKGIFLYGKRYVWSYCESFKSILDGKPDLFSVRSSFLPIGSSFSPMRSATVTYSLVALLEAVLLKWMKWVATEPFRSWPKRHNKVAQWIGLKIKWRHEIGSDEHVRNKFWLLKSRSIYCSCFEPTHWHCPFQIKLLLYLLKRWI